MLSLKQQLKAPLGGLRLPAVRQRQAARSVRLQLVSRFRSVDPSSPGASKPDGQHQGQEGANNSGHKAADSPAALRPSSSPTVLRQRARRAAGAPQQPRPTTLQELMPGGSALRALARSNAVALPRQQLLQLQRTTAALLQQTQAQQAGQQQATGAGAEEEAPLSAEAMQLIILCMAVAFICSIDRAAMSVALLPMSAQFGWDDATKGAVSAAFFSGYMFTNLFGGFVAAQQGPNRVLPAGVALWSAFTMLTPTAAAGALPELLLSRAVMGLGEGVTYPCVQQLVGRWVPREKRSRALALIYSGHQLGTIGSFLIAPLIISHLGWEAVFLAFGSLGGFWLFFWQRLMADPTMATAASSAPASATAAAAPTASTAASAAAGAGTAAPAKPAGGTALRLQDVPWAKFAASPACWAIVAAQVSVTIGNTLAFSWLPTFYHDVYGVDVSGSSWALILPFLATVAATNASGWIADGLVNNQVSLLDGLVNNQVLNRTQTRKLMQGVASLGPVGCLLQLAGMQSSGAGSAADAGAISDAAAAMACAAEHAVPGGAAAAAIALVTAWISLCGFSASGFGSNHQDISKEYSGIIYGLSNALASVGASASVYATGQLLNSTHDWGLIFEGAAGVYLLGALVYLKYASAEDQGFSSPQPPQQRQQAGPRQQA